MKNTLFIGSAFLIAMAIPFSSLGAPKAESTCVVPKVSEVEKLFDRWNAALQTRDPQKISSLYAEEGVLLPTLYNAPRTNHEELEKYFSYFVKKYPSGKIDSRVIQVGCNWATDTGVYTFTLYDDYPKNKKTVSARFSYAYEFINGQWLIISHHSSLMPNSKDPVHDKEKMSELEPEAEGSPAF